MAPHPQRLTVTRRAWPLARPLMSADGIKTAIDIVVAEISDGDSRGRGEGVPLQRYGETIESIVAELEALKGAITSGLNRDTLQSVLPPGAARNALDCAFWDIDAKRAYCSVADLAGLGPVTPVVTAFTLDFDTPGKMAEQAAANRTRPLLRLELGGDGDVEHVRAVREAAPAARLIVDANEGWNERQLSEFMPTLIDCRVQLIEQPLPPGADDALAGLEGPIPICADESCRTLADLDRLEGKYQAITIKLDKAGGLTEALALAAEAKRRGLRITVGGAISTSLGVAPALLVAQHAEVVDLGGPLCLALDRAAGCATTAARFIRPIQDFGEGLGDGRPWPVDWSVGRSHVSLAPSSRRPDRPAEDRWGDQRRVGPGLRRTGSGDSILQPRSLVRSSRPKPIELAFPKLKALLRARAIRIAEALRKALEDLWDSFSPAECANYVRHACYFQPA